MIISSSITIGQITFVLRVAIQVLAYVSLGLISVIILASVSRVAPIDTHSLMNRVVGSYTVTASSLKWIFGQIRHKPSNTSPKYFLLICLSVSYTAFVALSDIGFIGFHACQVPSPDITDFPASVTSRNIAFQLVTTNMANGTDVSRVFAHRCDSSSPVRINRNVTSGVCSNWYNSTYTNSSFYKTNLTDSDSLMSRQLTNYRNPRAPQLIGLNSFYAGPNTQLLRAPTIERGLVVEPHDMGVRMVVGVPQLQPSTKVDIANTLAVEVDIGCMTLGVRDIDPITYGYRNIKFATNGTWRRYVGPDYMEDVLSKTVDETRDYLRLLFNSSTLDSNGLMASFNSSTQHPPAIANVDTHWLPTVEGLSPRFQELLLKNCTKALREKLGIADDPIYSSFDSGNMCGLLGVGGPTNEAGRKSPAFERMVCTTATQVNMVDATIRFDTQSKVSVNFTRIPSDLHIVTATDFWKNLPKNDLDKEHLYAPYQRYTLNPNPNSPRSHFVYQAKKPFFLFRSLGPGSAGNAISWVGHRILDLSGSEPNYMGLKLLPDDGTRRTPSFDPSEVTKLLGEVGGSFLLTSLGLNGWVALQSPPMRVVSTGGRIGTCYKPYYAIAFVPVVFSAVGLFVWMLMSMLSGSWFGTKVIERGYDGVTPYTAVACPKAPPKDTLLAWEVNPKPRLQVVEKDYILEGDANATTLEYLSSAGTNTYS